MFPIQEVTDIEMVFGAKIERLLPVYKTIPQEFKKVGGSKWERVADRWFARGLRGVARRAR